MSTTQFVLQEEQLQFLELANTISEPVIIPDHRLSVPDILVEQEDLPEAEEAEIKV